MTFRKHLRFLYEMFLPREARFPDEKFWTKSGEPVAMKRGGPPKGTVGTTAKDWGVKDDEPDDSFDPDGPSPHARDALFDRFSQTFPEFQKSVYDAARRLFGKDFDQVIDQAFNKPGFTKQAIRDMWESFRTDHEALNDIGFLFDTAQGGGYGSVGPSGYSHVTDPHYFTEPREDWDPVTHNLVPRTGHPKGFKNGMPVY